MLITDQFVMINFPKTGTRFARDVLKKIHMQRGITVLNKLRKTPPGLTEIRTEVADKQYKTRESSHHGTCRQIPKEHQDKSIVSISRDPFSRYTSLYIYKVKTREFRHPSADAEEVKKLFPSFPNLSFRENYDMIHHFSRPNRLKGITPKIDLGLHTIQFIQFFFKNPDEVLSRIDDDYIQSEKYKDDMFDVQFIHQENLNVEFKSFLLNQGYSEKECSVIDTSKKINVSKRGADEQDQDSFYDAELRELILKRDALLFKIFPEYLIPSS